MYEKESFKRIKNNHNIIRRFGRKILGTSQRLRVGVIKTKRRM